MNLYIIGIVFFAIVVIACIFILSYLKKDELNLMEVSTKELNTYGKKYSKEEFENEMFKFYTNILSNIEYKNFDFLKDSVSDDIYNQILINLKRDNENNYTSVINNITKDFSKLISFNTQNDLEVAKFWVKYSSIEYVKKLVDKNLEDGTTIKEEEIVSGSKDSKVNHSYILTFVKTKSNSEEIICPNCGYKTNILTSSKCIRCDNVITSKKLHWVYIGNEVKK